VFTARYALSPYIKQIRSVFKGLMSLAYLFSLNHRFSNRFPHENSMCLSPVSNLVLYSECSRCCEVYSSLPDWWPSDSWPTEVTTKISLTKFQITIKMSLKFHFEVHSELCSQSAAYHSTPCWDVFCSYSATGRLLCGDGFMDFLHRPKRKILKILKN
jgi:hypothetical protein